MRASPRAGYTLIEILIVMVVMMVAVTMYSSSVGAIARQREISRESAVAAAASQVALERMRDCEFRDLWPLYNADPDDDPGGAGTAPGSRFAIPGLDALPDSPDGLQGEVILPAIQRRVGELPIWELREDFEDTGLGMPRDLTGDEVVDSFDHAEDYRVLPVMVRVQWQGPTGPRRFQVHSLFSDMRRR